MISSIETMLAVMIILLILAYLSLIILVIWDWVYKEGVVAIIILGMLIVVSSMLFYEFYAIFTI